MKQEKIETIGIPRSLMYYRYKHLWKPFFEQLNIPYIISPKTNKKILEDGKKYSQDESCLSLKIFIGHISYLQEKCNHILIPRTACLKKNEKMCTNFLALPDIIRNIFETKVIELNIDEDEKLTEEKAFINLGLVLNKTKKETLKAYKFAKQQEIELKEIEKENIDKKLKDKNLKILVVGHEYNIEDELVGKPITNFLEEENITIIKSNITFENNIKTRIIQKNYWTQNKELLENIEHYKNDIDGIILITTFPCGPDSLTNEIILRTQKIPILQIIIDEQNDNAGIITRLESFTDILKMKEGIK